MSRNLAAAVPLMDRLSGQACISVSRMRESLNTFIEMFSAMNPTSISRAEAAARAASRDQIDLQEARLWDRARLNLLLLYGGRRGGVNSSQSSGNSSTTSPFGSGEIEI